MIYADYSFYCNDYMGVIDGATFQRLVVRASSFIDYITGGKAAHNSELVAVKMCCCALVDKYAAIESASDFASRDLAAALMKNEPELKSESVGSYSRTLATAGESATAAIAAADNARALLNRTCQEYLAHTGLLYRGGRKCTLPML